MSFPTAEAPYAPGSSDALGRCFTDGPLITGVVELLGDEVLHVAPSPAVAPAPPTAAEHERSPPGVPDGYLTGWRGHFRRSREEGKAVRFRHAYRAEGRDGWLEATLDHVGGARFVYLLEEVTAQVEQEHASRLAGSRESALLRALPDLIFRLSADGYYLDVQAPDEGALAAPSEVLVGRSIDEFLPRFLADQLHLAIQRARATGEVGEIEYDLTTDDGVARRFEARISPYVDFDEVLVIVRDVTEPYAVQRAVSATAGRLRALVQNFQAAVLLEDDASGLVATNQQFCDTFGIPGAPESLVGADCSQALAAALPLFAHPEAMRLRVAETLAARTRVLGERVDFADGRIMERDYVPISLDGTSGGHFWLYRDVTARVEAEEQLRKRETRYRLLAENTRDLVALHAPDGRFEWVSPSVSTLLGYTPAHFVGTCFLDHLHPEDAAVERARVEARAGNARPFSTLQRVRHCEGHFVWLETLTQPIRNPEGAVVGLQSASRDVTERREMEQQLIHQAFHDQLTALPNRELFHTRLEQVLSQPAASRSFAVLFLDLDRFKVVNDTLGHSAGDRLLVTVAQRLQSVVRPVDTVARMGGDEFVILLDGVPTEDFGEQVAARVHAVLAPPVHVDGHRLFAGASVGLVHGRPDHATPDAVLREADLAMYEAKQAGRGVAVTFSEAAHGKVTHRLRLEMDLRHAVERDELFVLYQPLVRLHDGALAGFEALVRWQHPELGLLAPDAFLGPARDSGQLSAIDRWVLHEACRTAAGWGDGRGPGRRPLRVNVNCSGHDLLSATYADEVLAIVAEHGLGPDRLALEITEQLLIRDEQAVAEQLRRLQAGGVRVSLDDFGTGYSSLATLHALPVDTVKVDRSFVSQMVVHDKSHQLVEMVVQLGRILDKSVVAEGIEDASQLGALRTVGCAYGQGYLFDRPLSTEQAGLLAVAEACPWQTHWAAA